MKIRNIHERTIDATPEQIAQLLANFDGIWPTQIAPAPRPQGERLYKTSMMLWQRVRPARRGARLSRPESRRATRRALVRARARPRRNPHPPHSPR